MADNIENLMLEQFRRRDRRLENIEHGMDDMKLRMTSVEEHLGPIMMSLAGLNARSDKIERRIERIENRLDLTEIR